MNTIAIPQSPARRTRSSLHLAIMISLAVTAVLLTNLRIAPATAQEISPVGGYSPQAITLEWSDLPGPRSAEVLPHACLGRGSGFAPSIRTGFAAAKASPYYNGYVQTIWYRAWVQRWNGSSWVYYNGGRAWQKRIVPAYATSGAGFYGEDVPVATGSWYRVAEEFVYEVNGTRIGRALNVFNEYAYQKWGNVLILPTANGASACGIL